MKNILAIAFALSATVALAQPSLPLVSGSVALTQSNVSLFDFNTFAFVNADVYTVTVENPNTSAIIAIGLDLPNAAGTYLNNGNTATNPGPLVVAGMNSVADTVFISPVPTADLLGTGIVDTASQFTVNYAIAGGGVFVPANGGTAAVASLVVPTGATLDFTAFSGTAWFELDENSMPTFPGQAIFDLIPEPSTALLAGLALVGFVARRK